MKNIMKPFALFVLMALAHYSFSQSQITGIVTDETHHPLAFANVLLLTPTDSSLVSGVVTGEDGNYTFANVANGKYLLSVTMLGFTDHYSEVFSLEKNGSSKNMGTVLLNANIAQLSEINVVAKKQLFEQKIDRLVVNVEGSITAAGATALEILERSPGVIVNRQNSTISLAGKDGVVVMMNGKINRMPISAVVQLLEGMPSSNIQKIELITTPPANFDAEGNAGFINIVLKQSNDQGLNGSYSLSGGYGRGDVSSAGLNFNYRKNRFNMYGDYSFSRNAREQIFSFVREVQLNGQTVETNTRSVRDPVQRNHNARLGLDWNLGTKTVLGVLVSGYDNRWSMDALTRSKISTNGKLDTLIAVDIDEINQWKHFSGNLNLQHTFRENETLTFDADYLQYENKNPADYYTNYLDGNNNFFYKEQTFSGKVTPIKVGVARLDYAKHFSEKITMEVGIKGTLSRFDNDVTVANIQNDIPIYDPALTAEYKLEESIGAAYTAFDVALDKKTQLKLGLRYEYTNSNLGTVEQADIVDRHYGNFFPSVFLSRTFNEQNSTNFSYSRRITRPTFNDMAPFVFFFDPSTFFSGNAALQPSISNNVKLDYRYKTALFSIQYTVEDSAISRFQQRIIEGTNKVILEAKNMKNRKTAALTVAFPVQVAKWWNIQNNLIGTWQEVNAYYDENPVQLQTQNLQIVWINSFTLPKDFSAELVGFYQTKSLDGAGVALPMGALNVGIQKKLNGNWGTLRFGVDDLLNSLKYRFETNFPEYNIVGSGDIDFSQRTFKLTYSRNFGNNKLQGARQRTTGSEEERQRVN